MSYYDISCNVDEELRNLIRNTPEIAKIRANNYRFRKFWRGTLKGFTGYWLLEGKTCTYAFVVVLALEKGWGHCMMQQLILEAPADLLIWVASAHNWRSVRLAERLGFSIEEFQTFQKCEQNLDIQENGYVGALRTERRRASEI
jgi:hypothetical protein